VGDITLFAETKKFTCEVMQDREGGYSAKRLGMFALLVTFISVVIGNVFFEYKVDANVLASLVTVITWFGGFIASERLSPADLVAFFRKKEEA
jgi:hypothetical protein